MSIRSPLTAFWALVAVNIIWGFGFVVVDEAINVMPVNTFNAFRFGLATLVLLPLYFFSKKQNNQQSTYQVLEVWLSAVIATIGLYFLTMGDKMEFNKGDILVAISALCYALHITFMAKSSTHFPVMLMSIVQLAAVAFYSTLCACYEWLMALNPGYPPVLEQISNSSVLAALFYSAVFASAFAFWAQTASQRLIEPHKIALIFALEPIFAHLAAFFILSEHLGLQGWLGATLIISAMLYSELGGKKKIKIQALDQMAAPIETEYSPSSGNL
jgi:drug/metabolite transporter (DMT)-like permease